MAFLHAALLLYFAILVSGLASALAARLSEGSRHQALCQGTFFVCLALVGVTVITSLSASPSAWLFAGATFSIMVVGVTCDFSRCRRQVA